VTITQRTALVHYHDRELRLLDGQGAWELLRIHEESHGEGAAAAAAAAH
jgi:hypothetical protein